MVVYKMQQCSLLLQLVMRIAYGLRERQEKVVDRKKIPCKGREPVRIVRNAREKLQEKRGNLLKDGVPPAIRR
jgi:hypothetical protein